MTDPSGREAVLTIARSNGKTTLAAALAAAGLAGPLSVPRGQVIVVAASMGQARLTFEHTRWFLEPFVHEAPKDWRVIEHSHECRIEHRPTGAHMRAIGSDNRKAHGLAPKIAIADEPAQWNANHGAGMYAAFSTALAKQPGSVFVAVGTRPEDETHWFSEMLKEDKPGVYRQVHAASEGSPDFAMSRTLRPPLLRWSNRSWSWLWRIQLSGLQSAV